MYVMTILRRTASAGIDIRGKRKTAPTDRSGLAIFPARLSRGGGSVSVFGGREQLREGGPVVDGEFGQRLAVNHDAALLEAGDQTRIRQTLGARGRVDAGDPERAEVALAH